jgi:hypothetical protein
LSDAFRRLRQVITANLGFDPSRDPDFAKLQSTAEFRSIIGRNQREIAALTVLERRNPAFDGITTGVIAGNSFYYIANPQTDKQDGDGLRPVTGI